jgi:hypothetical protein
MDCAYNILTPGSAHHNDIQAINGTCKTTIHSNGKNTPIRINSHLHPCWTSSFSSMPHKFHFTPNLGQQILGKNGKGTGKIKKEVCQRSALRFKKLMADCGAGARMVR